MRGARAIGSARRMRESRPGPIPGQSTPARTQRADVEEAAPAGCVRRSAGMRTVALGAGCLVGGGAVIVRPIAAPPRGDLTQSPGLFLLALVALRPCDPLAGTGDHLRVRGPTSGSRRLRSTPRHGRYGCDGPRRSTSTWSSSRGGRCLLVASVS